MNNRLRKAVIPILQLIDATYATLHIPVCVNRYLNFIISEDYHCRYGVWFSICTFSDNLHHIWPSQLAVLLDLQTRQGRYQTPKYTRPLRSCESEIDNYLRRKEIMEQPGPWSGIHRRLLCVLSRLCIFPALQIGHQFKFRHLNRDINQVILHLWSKFGYISLNGWCYIFRTSLWLTHTDTHTRTHRQRQCTEVKTGLG